MENNQKIKCNVCSCKYNTIEDCMCKLDEITVEPFPEATSRSKDETICGNYKSGHK